MAESGLSISGKRTTGQPVRTQNVTAALAVSNIVKSSLGPVGLDKMLVDQVGDVTITNDGATILKMLEVKHPAGKVLVELSTLQDEEVGDGTTGVVIVAAELLKLGNRLVENGIHPTSVIAGFQLAKREACKFVRDHLAIMCDSLGEDALLNAAKTSMSSKIIGAESDFFARMAVDAVQRVKHVTKRGKTKYPVKAISILKAHGKSIRESELVDGFALNCRRAAQGMPQRVDKAVIALLDIDLRKSKMAFGVQVLINDPKSLDGIRDREGGITKDRIRKLIDAGVNVVFTTKGIDDLAMKVFVEAGVMAVRRVERGDMKHIARACGGRMILSMADDDGEESVDPSSFGHAEEVVESKVGDGELIYIKGCATTRAQTIVLRGANDFMLDEVDRSLHDSLCIIKRTLESKAVVPGGGAVEAALSVHLEALADTMGSREQLAVAAFSQALLVIPKTLAANGAHDSTELVARLRAYHHLAQTDEGKKRYKNCGLDLDTGKVRDNVKAGVLEPAMAKIKALRFATEAAVTVLRIDDQIVMAPKQDPADPHADHY